MTKDGRLKRRSVHFLLLGLALLTGCVSADAPSENVMTPMQRAQAGKALWEEKCRTVAGEKIYKTVPDVEGVLLMKIRPTPNERDLADPMWPGAAFALESRADGYITTFLGYERASYVGNTLKRITDESRGFIDTTRVPGQSDRPGYRYVDVIDSMDGMRYRYSGSEKVVGKKDVTAINVKSAMARDPNYNLNVYRWTLDKTPAPDPSPRYGVTYEDHVIPEERALGLASSTVRVIDLQTQEVLGEMLRYAWTTPPTTASPSPWLRAWKCPGHTEGANASTRKFVDRILIPKPEK